MNCQFKVRQGAFLARNGAIDSALRSPNGISNVLNGTTSFDIVGTGGVSPFLFGAEKFTKKLRMLWEAAYLPETCSLYLLILVCLGIEALVV